MGKSDPTGRVSAPAEALPPLARVCFAHRPIRRATQGPAGPPNHGENAQNAVPLAAGSSSRPRGGHPISAATMTSSGPWSMKPSTSGNLLRVQDAQEIPRPRRLVAGADQHFDSSLALRALLGGRITHDPIRTERARRALAHVIPAGPSGSGGARRPSLADYVTATGAEGPPRERRPPPDVVRVAYPLPLRFLTD